MLSNLFLMRKSYSYRTDLLQMLSKLFLLRKRFVTFAKGVTLTDLLQILSKLFLMSNRLVTFAEEAVNTAQVVSHEKQICYFCGRVIVTEQICYKC